MNMFQQLVNIPEEISYNQETVFTHESPTERTALENTFEYSDLQEACKETMIDPAGLSDDCEWHSVGNDMVATKESLLEAVESYKETWGV
jgi:hypothetical protein